MEMLLRGAAVYLIVWIIFRLSGRRTMAQITVFDFVLLLICGEATQQALLAADYSVTNGAFVVLTLVSLDAAITGVRARVPWLERIFEGLPMLIVRDGAPLRERMRSEKVDDQDVLHAARQAHGLRRFDQIRHAVLETDGSISVIPAEEGEQGQG